MQQKAKKTKTNKQPLIPTGSTLLNLACSGEPYGAFEPGRIINIIGDSHTGKTLLMLSILAECASPRGFSDYRLYYRDVENALADSMKIMFGETAKKRVDFSNKINYLHQYRYELENLISLGAPFIHGLDSLDALFTREDRSHLRAEIKASSAGKAVPGSYRLTKPKQMSDLLAGVKGDLAALKSTLFIISQTRTNINAFAFGPTKRRAGGDALKFYSSHELWLAVEKTIKKDGIPIGVQVRVKQTKNKLTGKRRDARLIIYDDYGIDDISANLSYLIENKMCTKHAGKYKLEGQKEAFTVRDADDDVGLQQLIRTLVFGTYYEIENRLKQNRKPKYE